MVLAAVIVLGAVFGAGAEVPVLLPWGETQADQRQVVRVSAPVLRIDPVASFTVDAPVDRPVRVVTPPPENRLLPAYRAEDGRVSVRLSGQVHPGQKRLLCVYWPEAGDWEASPVLDAAPAPTDDYATVAYGDAWDFDEGDQEGIQSWGNRPTEYGEVIVRDGRLVVPVTGNDPYFIWGAMFGTPGPDTHVERIDSALYTTLSMRLRQSCAHARWSLFVTDTTGRYQTYDFDVEGLEDQVLSFELPALFPEFWDGREFRALRLDTTNDAPGTTVEIDWVRLLRPSVTTETGPRLTREAVQAREAVARIKADLLTEAHAGDSVPVRAVGADASGRPVPGVPFAVALAKDTPSTSPPIILCPDASGAAQGEFPVGTQAARYTWQVGACDDLGHPAMPMLALPLTVLPAVLDHYELIAERPLVLVDDPRVEVAVWGADRFGNRMAADVAAPRWRVTGGASVEYIALHGAPAKVAVTCSDIPLTRHEIALCDETGRSGTLEVTTMSLKHEAVRLAPNGYLVDAAGRLFVPLGGFYANWPSGLPAADGSIARAVDLFPCGPTPYTCGFPWTPEVEQQVADYLGLCKKHGVTALRLMLRNMDLVGRVDPGQLQAVLHLFDVARPLGIRFDVALFEDYTKPPYVNPDVLEKVVLPQYSEQELKRLPPYRARFLVEKRLVANGAARYTDPDALACQRDYLMDLLPHLAARDEVFCYEFENEMVRPPMSWVNATADIIRGIDPRTPILGNPGPHAWPEPWRWRDAKIDLFSYHPYNDGQPDADHGAVIFMDSKWAAACGRPMFTGEGGLNQNRWQEGVAKVPPAYTARGVRDQIWLSLCCGANGAFIWTPMHEGEMAEFGKVLPALDAVGVDLLTMQRRRPRVAVVMPKDDADNEKAYALGSRLLARGVDFDTLPADAATAYETCIPAATEGEPPPEIVSELGVPGTGYQLAYLASQDATQALVYLRNAAGGIVNLGDERRPCYLREPKPADAALELVGEASWVQVKAYDLDEGREVAVERPADGRRIVLGTETGHDYVVGLRR